MDSSSSGDDIIRWKLSKKGRSRSGRPHAMDATSAVLSRSYSANVVSSSRIRSTISSSAAAAGTGSSSSSYSAASSTSSQQAAAAADPSSSSSSRLSKKKCVEAVKEHRARFYIVRRCVSMLVCWRDY